MWFKNLQVYRLPAAWSMSREQLEAALTPQAFTDSSGADLQNQGWASPRNNGMLVHAINRQFLLLLATEKKLLPASVVNQVSKARAADIEEQQGFAPGRKQMKELKEQVTDELLPRAFSIRRDTAVWIDPVHGWLVVDAATAAKADEAIRLLIKSVERLPLRGLHVKQSPVKAMTDWLLADEAPSGFSVDQDTELRSTAESKATVRYVRHALEAQDVRRHIESGKQCTRLAMTWADRVSFVLTENLTIKRITPLDVIKESGQAAHGSASTSEDERFDTDFVLMCGELDRLLSALIEILGGEVPEQIAA